MKCSKCGNEFGSGVNCQNCGVDRVTGLANYSGYDNHIGNGHHSSSDKMEYVPNRTTACYACGEIIPSDAEYCPYCRKNMYVNCPKCGEKYSSQYDNCPKCGTNRIQYYQMLEDEEEAREIRNRAAQLEYSFSSLTLYIFVFMILAGVLFFLFFHFFEYMTTLWCWIIFILALAIGCPYLSSTICEIIKDRKIQKWKQEHPNDPRNKYL